MFVPAGSEPPIAPCSESCLRSCDWPASRQCCASGAPPIGGCRGAAPAAIGRPARLRGPKWVQARRAADHQHAESPTPGNFGL
eukprot:5150204-Alexandrium_andersonii.AAC.1